LVGIISLFVVSSFAPLSFGINISSDEQRSCDDLLLEDYYGCYSLEEIPESIRPVVSEDEVSQDISKTGKLIKAKDSPKYLGGPMDSLWPMYCHDTHHSGRSPYSTVGINSTPKWRLKYNCEIWGSSPAIDKDGIIYLCIGRLDAIYPNGTKKWGCKIPGYSDYVTPAIDENGVVYVGANKFGKGLHAINPNGTMKWTYKTADIFSSPAIGIDGTVYFGDENYYINALWPNGTLRWRYKTGNVVYSSPAIGDDGTVYCGSHDKNLYALYPNNGTVKWKYKTGNWIRTAPCIADDGTIYVVSIDGPLHALYPNGTLKWKTGVGAGTSPTIGQDGTIYCGSKYLRAVNPDNGSIMWSFNPGPDRKIRGGTPCNSADGTIYFAVEINWQYNEGGELIAVNPDGTEKWRKRIAEDWIESAPAIGEGAIYICSTISGGPEKSYLNAFGFTGYSAAIDGPYYQLINQPVHFKGEAYNGVEPYAWFWEFGDGDTSEEQNPSHIYTEANNYTVTLTVTDDEENIVTTKNWVKVQATNAPPDKPVIEGPKKGYPHQHYDYTFVSLDPEENPIWYYIDWDDGKNTGWFGIFKSGQKITLTQTWHEEKVYIIKAKAKDIFGDESDWATFKVNLPRNKAANSYFINFLERFPLLKQLFSIYFS
jgi:outer membrane protein assembly factor BamB